MDSNEIELEDDEYKTPRGIHTPSSQSSCECDRQGCDNDECAELNDTDNNVHSSIDIESISIALDNSPSTTVSTCSDDHKTNRNLLSVQKEEAFQDWLAAKKFVYTKKTRHTLPTLPELS